MCEMRTRGEGVKKSENFADVINGRPEAGSSFMLVLQNHIQG